MKNHETTAATILETLEGLKIQDDSVNAIIKTAIAAVKEAEESAAKEAALTALAAVLNVSTAELASIADDQLAVITAVPDGQKKAVFTAFKNAADFAAEIQTLKRPKSAKNSAAKSAKLTIKQAYTCLQAYETICYKTNGQIMLSALLSEPLRFLRCNISDVTIELMKKYEASFRASYLSADYIEKLGQFIGPRFVDDRNIIETALEEALKSAAEQTLKLVP